MSKLLFWDVNSDSYVINNVKCTSVEVGYFLISTSSIPMLFNSSFSHDINPRLTYENHMKELYGIMNYMVILTLHIFIYLFGVLRHF